MKISAATNKQLFKTLRMHTIFTILVSSSWASLIFSSKSCKVPFRSTSSGSRVLSLQSLSVSSSLVIVAVAVQKEMVLAIGMGSGQALELVILLLKSWRLKKQNTMNKKLNFIVDNENPDTRLTYNTE